MSTDEPTPETFSTELDQVIARHNECFQQAPGFMIAILIQEAGYRAGQHGLDVELVEQAGDVYLFEIGESAAAFSADPDPRKLEALESDWAMVDHRALGGQP